MDRLNNHLTRLSALVLVISLATLALADEFVRTGIEDKTRVIASDWPWWRGPLRNGEADSQQNAPTAWNSSNLIWKAPVPGRGHGSPILVGNNVYLQTADRKRDVQTVICYDRETGSLKWEETLFRGGIMKKNQKASQASSSVAWDGERLFANFLNDGAVYTTAMTDEGKQLWQAKISDYVIHQGYASSPAIYQHLVIVSADNKGGGKVVALDRKTGEQVWEHSRPKIPNYSSPVIVRAAGKDQLIFIGCELVTSLNPLTGETNWEVEGATQECVTTTVTDGTHVFSSGGWPKNHVAAIKADGSGEVVWEEKARVYVPSMLIKDGYLYAVLDAGVATCWKSDTGKQMWKSRLGGDFSSSPVLVGDQIFASNERGENFVFKARPDKFELVAKSKFGDSVFATPAICESRIYSRVAIGEGDEREECLCCFGNLVLRAETRNPK